MARRSCAGLRRHCIRSRSAVAYHPRRPLLASASIDGRIDLWDVARRRRVATLRGHRGRINDVTFSPDGRLLASSGYTDSTVVLWDVARRRPIAHLAGQALDVDFSPGGGTLAAAQNDRRSSGTCAAAGRSRSCGHETPSEWCGSVRTGACLRQGTRDSTSCSGTSLTVGGSRPPRPHALRVEPCLQSGWPLLGVRRHAGWRHSLGCLAAQAPCDAHRQPGRDRPDGVEPGRPPAGLQRFPARRVRLWDVERRRRLASLATPSPVSGIAFSSDGDQLAIGSVDGSIRLRGARRGLAAPSVPDGRSRHHAGGVERVRRRRAVPPSVRVARTTSSASRPRETLDGDPRRGSCRGSLPWFRPGLLRAEATRTPH